MRSLQPALSRRRLLAASLAGLPLPAAAAPPGMPLTPSTAPRISAPLPSQAGLWQIAAAHGRRFGAAVQNQLLTSDPQLAALTAAECGLLMPDYEVKWGVIQPMQGVFNFGPIDALIAWAKAHDKAVRGHGLVWYQNNPDWLTAALMDSPKRAYGVLGDHIAHVLDHTRPVIREWDVVNEPIAEPPGSDVPQAVGELRDCVWLRTLGPGYIGLALRLCREHDATLRLAINEFGVEENAPHHVEKRRRLLSLVRTLKHANVPLDAVGIQGHLQMVQPFSAAPFTQFCRDLRAEGVELVVTEMDVREHWKLPQGIAARDQAVADRVKAFMDAAIDGGIKTFITWGLMDKYSWLTTNVFVRRNDGQAHRGLPFDEDGKRRPFWFAMADALSRPPVA